MTAVHDGAAAKLFREAAGEIMRLRTLLQMGRPLTPGEDRAAQKLIDRLKQAGKTGRVLSEPGGAKCR